ncbi:LRP2-binding protein isoform 2-T2 [Pelodytes ibericus]
MKKLSSESLPKRREGHFLHTVCQLRSFPKDIIKDKANLLEIAISYLKRRIKEGDAEAHFLLGQLYFEEGWYEDALLHFEKVKETDYQALYQMGVMYYDGLGVPQDTVKGLEYMKRIFTSKKSTAKHLKCAAAYNIGTAYFEGYGVTHSDNEAERWWLLAADDGNPKGVLAQSVLGMYYSRPETQDLQKAFFWHSEACANGSLESQGVLGVMYLTGQGTKKNLQFASECLKEAAERGNTYAQGYLVAYYYHMKFYTLAAELAKKIIQNDNIDLLAKESDCLPLYIAKGLAMATFYLARCLHLGLGINEDYAAARKLYGKACHLDADVASDLHSDLIYQRI